MANNYISFKKITLTSGQTIQNWLASYYYPNIGSWPAYTRFTFYNTLGDIVGEYINDRIVINGVNESELLTKEDKVNKVTTISSTPTDINYPSEKAVKTALDNLLTTVNTSLDNKVNKNASITGGTFTKITFDSKGLVTGGANLTKADIPNIDATQVIQDAAHRFVTDTEKSTWNNKVDKVAGKGLSTEDYTSAEKTKLDSIETGAQVNVGTNLSQGARNTTTLRIDSSTGNNLTLPAVTTSLAGLMSSTDKTKLDGIATNATANEGTVTNVSAGTTQVSGLTLSVANGTTTPTITTSISNAGNFRTAIGAGTSNLALGETSSTAYRGDRGKTAYDHSQVAHAPSNAQKNSDITKAEIEAKLTGTITTHTHNYRPAGNVPWSEVSGKPSFAAVATSGSYNDLSNRPTIPSIPEIMTTTEGNAGTATTQRTINAANLKSIILNHSPVITGGASTITSSNLTASRALISNTDGKVGVSAITSTQLGYLSGASSNIQNQLDDKENHGNKVNSITTSSTTLYPSTGAVKTYVDTSIDALELIVNGKVEEAPNDGKVFARQNKDWLALESAAALRNALAWRDTEEGEIYIPAEIIDGGLI